MRRRKIPRFIGGSIGPRMEICGNSVLPILMVPRLYQSNGNIKRKLRAWRVQKCIALVSEMKYLPVRGRKVPHFMRGSIEPRMEICGSSGLPILMVPLLHQRIGYMKWKSRAWRVQKCFTQVCSDTVLTSAGPQSTPFHGE